MTYDLFIGDRLFSSWSLRGWLMLQKFGLPFDTHLTGLYGGTLKDDLAGISPARLVPALRTPDGIVVGETLAMAETLAERHPDAGIWPEDAAARARARWLCAEMATGFGALRGACPMQLAHVDADFVPTIEINDDLQRIETLWSYARDTAREGPWLFGRYTVADAFYAPVCARIIGYALPVSEAARAYCEMTINDVDFRDWRKDALKVDYDPFPYPPVGRAEPWPA